MKQSSRLPQSKSPVCSPDSIPKQNLRQRVSGSAPASPATSDVSLPRCARSAPTCPARQHSKPQPPAAEWRSLQLELARSASRSPFAHKVSSESQNSSTLPREQTKTSYATKQCLQKSASMKMYGDSVRSESAVSS